MQKKNSIIGRVNQTEIRLTNKKMTAYGGFALLAGFLEKLQFKDAITRIIPIIQTSPNALPIYDKVIAHMITVYAGGTHFSHMLYLGCKEILGELFGVTIRLPDASTTLTRMFGKIKSQKQANEINAEIWKYTETWLPWKNIKSDWLNMDSSILVRYGNQEGAEIGYNPKKPGRPSHHPLMAFLNQSGYFINIWNRPGNTSSNNNASPFFWESYFRVCHQINILGVLADSGFYEEDFISQLEFMGVPYVIAAKLYSTLQQKIYSQTEWEIIDEKKGIEATSFQFKHNDWEKERRYVVIRQSVDRRPNASGKQLKLFELETKGYRYSAHITSFTAPEKSPEEVWRAYRPRANDENTIRYYKEDFALGGFCMKKFFATEAGMIIRALFYNLFLLFKTRILPESERSQRLSTLRFKYFVVPAQFGHDGRQAILRISATTKKFRAKLTYLFAQVNQYIPPYMSYCSAVD